jgi:hypothetical protein
MYVTFPMLLMLCLVGLLIALLSRSSRNRGVYVAALAIAIAGFAQYLIGLNSLTASGAEAKFGVADLLYKLNEYWCPYFLVFPAAVLFDWIYCHVSKSIAVAILLALVIFPWSQNPNLDISYNEHPVAVEWAGSLYTAKLGWWQSSPDHRWVQSPAELALSEALRAEIRAGRITTQTHIVHVTPRATIWQDVLLHSVYTGIDDDIYVMHPDGDLSEGGYAGSRMRPIAMLPAALATNPPYIVVFKEPPPSLSLPPRGYEEIFHDDETIRLFRRDDLSSKALRGGAS